MEICWEAVLALVLVSGVSSAALGNPQGRAQDSTIASAIGIYNREQSTSSFFRLLDAVPKGRPIVKNCSASTTGEKTGASVVRCDTVINKPLFVKSRKQEVWKKAKDAKAKADGKGDATMPGIFMDSLHKLKGNYTGGSHIECVSCVICPIGKSCKKS